MLKAPNLRSGITWRLLHSDLTSCGCKITNGITKICVLIQLLHREIIGYSAGANKNAELVKEAWHSVKKDIRDICIFHTDRGSEFKNEDIDKILEIGGIERSLSRPGTPIDNAVCESMYDIVKTEFVFGEDFKSTEDLRQKLGELVWWYNN